MPPLQVAIILVFAPFAPLFSPRVWRQAQVRFLGAMLTPGARPDAAALWAMGLATERHFTHDHRVRNRATWSARRGSQMLRGVRLSLLVPPGAPILLRADDIVDRRSGRRITGKGGYRDAVGSTKKPVIRCVGLTWVAMRLLVPVPWARRGWALPLLTALCRPTAKQDQRRHQTRVDWVRQMIQHVRRWLPARQLVVVVDGGFAVVSLALACVKHQVAMVLRWRWDAALSHPAGPQPSGTRDPNPLQGTRQRRWHDWAERADTPWEDVDVVWYGGTQGIVGLFPHRLVVHPGIAPSRHGV